MGVNITGEQLVTGALDFIGDCIKNKRSPSNQLEYSNGETAAGFEYIIYKKWLEERDSLYWDCEIQKLKINIPVSVSYIAGYNQKAIELNMPLYNEVANMLKLISILAIFYNLYSRKSSPV